MRTVKSREAEAGFSAMIEAAERGEPTTITKHGKPAAVLVPIAQARRLYPEPAVSFPEHLLAYPGGLELERDETTMPSPDL